MSGSDMPRTVCGYRIVHVENLPLLLESGKLLSGSEMARLELDYLQIGLQNLTRGRQEVKVTCSPYGVVTDYVPFYFCPRSVMLYQIHTGEVSTYMGGQEPIVHLITSIPTLDRNGVPWVFTDRKAFLAHAHFSNDPRELIHLDWETIRSHHFSSKQDRERPERKMAELLAYNEVPWSAIDGIGVINDKYRSDVVSLLEEFGYNTPVRIKTGWYYS